MQSQFLQHSPLKNLITFYFKAIKFNQLDFFEPKYTPWIKACYHNRILSSAVSIFFKSYFGHINKESKRLPWARLVFSFAIKISYSFLSSNGFNVKFYHTNTLSFNKRIGGITVIYFSLQWTKKHFVGANSCMHCGYKITDLKKLFLDIWLLY